MDKGKLYGVGTGPGDPELITLKAIKIIKKCNYIAVPNKIKENAISYQIALSAIPSITTDILNTGNDIAFLTLGDPAIYSTYIYIHDKAKALGYQTEIINGIPSFCAASALINEGLANGSSCLHIIPSTYGIDESLNLPGTKVLMKAGRKMPQIKEKLRQQNISATLIENCGMENENVYNCIEHIPDNPSYYSLIIIKEE